MPNAQSLQVSHSDSVIECFSGKRGMGKSTLAMRRFEYLAKSGHYANLVVFDPLVCAYDFQDLAESMSLRLRYIEFDFDKGICDPAIPYGPPTQKGAIDWRRTLYLIDEADLLSSPGKIDPTLRKLIHYSRHWGDSILLTFRRWQNVHKDIESMATTLYIFNTTAPRDLDKLDTILEEQESRNGQMYSRDRIRKLHPYVHERYAL